MTPRQPAALLRASLTNSALGSKEEEKGGGGRSGSLWYDRNVEVRGEMKLPNEGLRLELKL